MAFDHGKWKQDNERRVKGLFVKEDETAAYDADLRKRLRNEVIGRYRNLGGATVEVTDRTYQDRDVTVYGVYAACGGFGCTATHTSTGRSVYTERLQVQFIAAQMWAQEHAETCRATERPGTGPHPAHAAVRCADRHPDHLDNPRSRCLLLPGHGWLHRAVLTSSYGVGGFQRYDWDATS